MLKICTSLLFPFCLLAADARAQSTPALAQSMQNVVQLSASATIEVSQDLLTMSMGTTRDGTDAVAVQSELKLALDAALRQARGRALAGQLDVRSGNFSLSPRYSREGRINGWQGRAEMVLEGRDFARIGSVAGAIQSLTVGSVQFSLSRDARERVESEVQTMAIDRFKAKAGAIAKAFGHAGYALGEVSVNASDQAPMPPPRMMAMEARSAAADAPVPLEAGKTSVVVTVSGSVQLK